MKEREGEIFQLSTMTALLAGIYDGAMSFEEIKEHGDFGIGTFEHLDGEMIAFDHQFYRLRGDGTATPLVSTDRTPFCSLTLFRPQQTKTFEGPIDKNKFEQELHRLKISDNEFYAFRLDGVFQEVSTRTVAYQKEPVPMTEAVKKQPVFHFKNVEGTLLGFWTPAFCQGIAVAGYHFHFIDKERKGGGHVMDYVLKHGTLQIDRKKSLNVFTPQTEAFLQADLSRANLDREIKSVEG